MVTTITKSVYKINEFLTALEAAIGAQVVACIEAQLEAEVERWLQRRQHQRRSGVQRKTQARCQRCGSQQANQFMRNGHRQRQLVTTHGVLCFWLPRVVCACGGSVQIPFSILQPYQQIWDNLLAQIKRWADLGLSLRQMQGEIADQIGTSVGLRTLNTAVQQVDKVTPITLRSVPPVLMLDAIWVTVLEPTEQIQTDRCGRRRRVKTRQKLCVLVALGLYPQTGHWGILGWHIAAEESQAAWEALLLPLEERGVYRQRGVELFIHDGGKGLTAALEFLYPTIPHQRCAFHKLRNLWHSLQTPLDLTRAERIAFKKDILQPVQAIFYAVDEHEALRQRDALCQRFADTQPDFVATLQRDWSQTIAFFQVLKRFPQWRRSALRTTSLLERLNRMLRRLFRPAGAFHSRCGLLTRVLRVLSPKRLI